MSSGESLLFFTNTRAKFDNQREPATTNLRNVDRSISPSVENYSEIEKHRTSSLSNKIDENKSFSQHLIRSFVEEISFDQQTEIDQDSNVDSMPKTNFDKEFEKTKKISKNKMEIIAETDRETIKTDDDRSPRRSLSRTKHESIHFPPSKLSNKVSTPSHSVRTRTGKSSSFKLSNTLQTPRSLALVPSMTRRLVQGVLVRFFRVSDQYHRGVQLGINQIELKSWEAFLNYLNRQPNLVLGNGGIRHVYTLNGDEIRSIQQFQHRQSYVVSSGVFVQTNFRYLNDDFLDDEDNLSVSIARSSAYPRWQVTSIQATEPMYIIPYSKLNVHEVVLINRNVTIPFDDWLTEHITDLMSSHIHRAVVRFLFAVTKFSFVEVRSFSKLFHMFKLTDTFICCTEDEYIDARNDFDRMRPSEIFLEHLWKRSSNEPSASALIPRKAMEDGQISLSWIYGYDGSTSIHGKLHGLPSNEILYVVGSICILIDPNLHRQRFYSEHQSSISALDVHRIEPIVASTEISSTTNNQRAVIHVWNHLDLSTITEIRNDQFGTKISILKFSRKSTENFLLVVSNEKPEIVFFIDWKENEMIYTISCKKNSILSVSFPFENSEWVGCVSEQRILFYHLNWSSKPVRMVERRESQVQNIYTGAADSDRLGERFLVGDKVGNLHVWRLIDNEPKLISVQENFLESDVASIVSIGRNIFALANSRDQIKVWNTEKNLLEEIRLNEKIGSIRSICSIEKDSSAVGLAIGTQSNYLIAKTMDVDEFHIITRGLNSCPIAICVRPKSHQFFTVGCDQQLFKWNNRKKSIDWSAKSNQPFSCGDLHPERNIIVVGTETSKIIVYDTLSSFYITTVTLQVKTGVKSIRFSPDGKLLAAGLQNGSVFVFDVFGNGDFQLKENGVLPNEGSSVVQVSWSIDKEFLIAIYNDNDYNLWSTNLELVRGKKIQQISWDNLFHPIINDLLDPKIAEFQRSLIQISPNVVLCCGNDGQLRLFRNSFRNFFQNFQFFLGPIRNVVPSAVKNKFLVSFVEHPIVAEIEIKMRSVEI